jgi:hypothetical protein
MKKSLLIICILFSSRIYSQDIIPFTFGPQVSFTSTSFTADPEFYKHSSGSGYNIGAFARLKVLMLYAQLEASYASKNTSVVLADSTSLNTDLDFTLNGVDVSLLAGLKLFGLGSMGNFRVFAGYCFNNYSDITYKMNGQDLSTENINTSNNSILGGIGVDLSKFTFDLKYIYGISDISSAGNQKINTNVISATLGFKIL